jgi:hypothetical protein
LLSPNPRWKLVACLPLFLASAERYNAAAATLPIIAGLFVWSDASRSWRRYTIAFAVWCGVTATAFLASRALIEKHAYPWHNSLALFDIAGTVRYTPTPIPDDELLAQLAGVPLVAREHLDERMRRAYSGSEWFSLTTGDHAVFVPPATDEQRTAVSQAWREVVSSHPRAYVFHRLRVLRAALDLTHEYEVHVWTGFTGADWQADAIGYHPTYSWLQRAWCDGMNWLDTTFVFRPWLYLVLSLAFLPLCRRHRLAFVVLASGVSCELSLLIAAPSADYRYSHWMIVCTIVAGLMIFTARLKTGSRLLAKPEPST